MTIEETIAGLTAAQRAGMQRIMSILGDWGDNYTYAKKPLIAAALYRKGLLDRVRQGQNPIHEPASEWWEYRLTPLGKAVRNHLSPDTYRNG